jgi:hypothetical protein
LVRLAPSVIFLAIVFTAWFSPVMQSEANGEVSPSAIAMPRPPTTTIPVTIPRTTVPLTIPVTTIPVTTIPLTAPTSVTIPEIPTSLPVSVTIPEIPTSLPVSATIPEIPTSLPESVTIPDIPSSIPTSITIPNIPSTITIPRIFSSIPARVTIPSVLSSILSSVSIPGIPSSLPSSITIPNIPSSLPESIVIPDVSLPTTLDDELINSLSSDLLTDEEVASVVAEITENVVLSNDQAAVLATSIKVLENLGLKKVAQVFRSIDTGNITEEQGEKIVETVQVANKKVRRSFEKNVNVFAGKFDSYVPLNSKINVEDRRTVVAVSVVSTAALTSMGVKGAMPMGGGAPSGGGSAELAEAFKSESSRIRRISKYKYENGRRVVDKKNFSRKLILSIMQNSFTLVGFIVVYLTLSGSVRTIAGIATLVAFFSTLYIDMREGEED